ncbi:tRNA (cytidine(34)-2'-O)-methyltransferase [Yunchengibacter salinarum]|uniref:tRNA (cytidine(34)-2'-O)-methyltransferase n=1 Tax=Yunchengibacter salinarum TaxID=3133399 RepID=UPI0035B59963
MHLALYQPDQPPNTGTMLRLGACLGVAVHVIEPAGFPFSRRAVRRYGLDYVDDVDLRHHLDDAAFWRWLDGHRAATGGRLILLTTDAATGYTGLDYGPHDVLMVGRESGGVPEDVHARADARARIHMAAGARSLNVAVAAAMVLGEALRQTGKDTPR